MGNLNMSEKRKRRHLHRVSLYRLPGSHLTSRQRNLTSQMQKEIKLAFAMQDKNSNGTISTKSFINVMRSLGENLTEEETNDMICEVDIF